MPTYDRRAFVPLAIQGFLRQDYADRELVIVDDGAVPVEDLVPEDPRIRYHRLPERLVLGAKRNLACELASGRVLVHWDDDDWYAPDRISRQVAALTAAEADVCGVQSLLFHDPTSSRAWRYRYPEHGRPWAAGSSLAFTRDFWERHHFEPVPHGEDTRLLWRADAPRLVRVDGPLLVATLHGRNTTRNDTGGWRWEPVPFAEVETLLGEDVAAYTRAARGEEPAPRPAPSTTPAPARVVGLPGPRGEPSATRSPGLRVVVGVVTAADGDGLRATLASLDRHTAYPYDGPPYEVVVVPDGPDPDVHAVLAGLPHLEQLGTTEPRGGAACLNRLAARDGAEVVVLLESGAQVAPGWLERLLSAFDDPRCGMAGPSTNRAWNDQALLPHAEGTPEGLARAACLLLERHGDRATDLAPLLSLGDFCYAVRVAALRDVDGADEGYGLGGRWEMDLNARAALAGWSGLWVKAAYVHRAPPSARRRREEAEHGVASSTRYRRRFCGRCPRASSWAGHCHGLACAEFGREVTGSRSPCPPGGPVRVRDVDVPLVSCIMPTGNRHALAVQAVEYFRRQDLASRELVIVDDGVPGLASELPDDPRVRYRHVAGGLSIGDKRNLACELARGELVAQWDDDDWYAPERLSRQVRPILDGLADVTGLTGCLFWDVGGDRLLAVSAAAHRRMFLHDVIGGTLVYRRRLLATAAYPRRSIAEDALFLASLLAAGARLVRVPNDDLFVYVRHGRNSWSFEPGRYLGSQHWEPVARPVLPAPDRDVYTRFSRQETGA